MIHIKSILSNIKTLSVSLTLTMIFTLTATAADGNTPADTDLEDGSYSIEVTLTGGSGKASVMSPTHLLIENQKAYATLTWSSSNYDYMLIGDTRYDNEAETDMPSTFTIPVSAFDQELPVIADTTAMGTPHEVSYTLNFASETIGPESELPQEAAMKVVYMALAIIVIGGILNHFIKKRYYE